MEVLLRGHTVRTGRDTKRRILDRLQTSKRGRAGIAGPGGGGEIYLGANENLVGVDQRLLVLAPIGAGQGLHHLEPLGRRLRQRRRVVREGEEGVQGQAQDLGIMLQREELTA